MTLSDLLASDALTQEQRETLRRLAPWGWAVVVADGYRALFLDEADAQRYAARCHGIILELRPTSP